MYVSGWVVVTRELNYTTVSSEPKQNRLEFVLGRSTPNPYHRMEFDVKRLRTDLRSLPDYFGSVWVVPTFLTTTRHLGIIRYRSRLMRSLGFVRLISHFCESIIRKLRPAL